MPATSGLALITQGSYLVNSLHASHRNADAKLYSCIVPIAIVMLG